MLMPSISNLFGAAVLGFLLWFIANTKGKMWRWLSAEYGRPQDQPTARRAIDSIIIAKGEPARFLRLNHTYYHGVAICVHGKGLAFSQWGPFGFLAPPMLLPYAEMEIAQTEWALWRNPRSIRMRRVPGVELIIGEDTFAWLGEHVDLRAFGRGNQTAELNLRSESCR